MTPAAARIVLEAARRLPRAYEDRVWIADVLRALPGLTRAELLAQHRAGRLTLSRCDLVQLHSPAVVAASEIEDRGATWHTLRVA